MNVSREALIDEVQTLRNRAEAAESALAEARKERDEAERNHAETWRDLDEMRIRADTLRAALTKIAKVELSSHEELRDIARDALSEQDGERLYCSICGEARGTERYTCRKGGESVPLSESEQDKCPTCGSHSPDHFFATPRTLEDDELIPMCPDPFHEQDKGEG